MNEQAILFDRRLTRRRFLTRGLSGTALLCVLPLLPHPAYAALVAAPARAIALNNLHTGESCALTYWENGAYVTDALAQINYVVRDHRTGEEHAMDPALLDLLTALHGKLDTTAPFEVISGYRSPQSNAAMHAHSAGVASKSLHMEGKAMDIRVPNRALAAVHHTALVMSLGGVGYYPTSEFVHVDTGRVRTWSGA